MAEFTGTYLFAGLFWVRFLRAYRVVSSNIHAIQDGLILGIWEVLVCVVHR